MDEKIKKIVVGIVQTKLNNKKKVSFSELSFKETNNYIIVANQFSIVDENEENDSPTIYWAIEKSNTSNVITVNCFQYEDNESVESFNPCLGKVFMSIDNDKSVNKEIYDAIISIAEEFTLAYEEEAEINMISPGYDPVYFLSNGDPGYPGADPEFEVTCPCCRNVIRQENATYRCDYCKKFVTVDFNKYYDRDEMAAGYDD